MFEFIAALSIFDLIGGFVFIIILLGLAAHEYFMAALILLIVGLTATSYFNSMNFNFLIDNWKLIILYAFGYVAIGVLYSVYRWYRSLVSNSYEIKRYYNSLSSKTTSDGNLYYSEKEAKRMVHEQFSPSRNVGMITSWIAYWPFSMVSRFAKFITVDLFNTVFKYFSNIYKRISESVVNNIIN